MMLDVGTRSLIYEGRAELNVNQNEYSWIMVDAEKGIHPTF